MCLYPPSAVSLSAGWLWRWPVCGRMSEAGPAGGDERGPGALLQAAENSHGGAHQQGLCRLC